VQGGNHYSTATYPKPLTKTIARHGHSLGEGRQLAWSLTWSCFAWGLSWPRGSLPGRWSLTPPFHPYYLHCCT